MNTIMNWLLLHALGWITSANGQQRIRTALVTVLLAVAAKFGLPPELADWTANTLLGAGMSLVLSYTVRKPAAPAPTLQLAPAAPRFDLPPAPARADGVPGDERG